MERKDGRRPTALVIALLAIVPYLNGLRGGFVFDDVPLIASNAGLRTGAGLAHLLVTDWWDGRRPGPLLYRPLVTATFAADAAVARVGAREPAPARLPDADAFPFHLQSVLWHAAASVALYFLIVELFASVALAGWAAALFAVHPVHTEAVDGLVGRAELMAACFGFLALIAAARAVRRDPAGWGDPLAAGAALLAALFSKEQAVAIPAVFVVWLAVRPREPVARERVAAVRATFSRGAVRVLAAFAVAGVLWAATRALVLGSPIGIGAEAAGALEIDNPIAASHGAARLLTPARVFADVARLVVFPATLSADYSFDQIPLSRSLDGATALGLAALVAAVAAAVALGRKRRAAGFALGVFLVTWLVTSNLFVPVGTILGERLLYLPSAGVCLAVAAVLTALAAQPRARVAVFLAGGALVALGAARTWARNTDWKDNLTLFAVTARTSPRSCKALNAYASELFTAGRAADARPWAERSLAIAPHYPAAHLTLAKLDRALAAGERDPAERRRLAADARTHAEHVLGTLGGAGDASPRADAWNVLGALALDGGDLDASATAYARCLALEPDNQPAVNGEGVVLASRARDLADPAAKDALQTQALARFERAMALDPADLVARRNAAATLQDLASRAADPARRDEMQRRAASLDASVAAVDAASGDVGALATRHGAEGQRLLDAKHYDEALAEFREAIRLEPAAARGYMGLGTVQAALADTDLSRREQHLADAIASFAKAVELEPGNAAAHLDLGVAYLRAKREPAKAAAEFQEALRIDPKTPMRAQMEATIRQLNALASRGN